MLNNELKKRICEVILRTTESSVECIQALLVISCFSEKGWLLTSMATRLCLDLDLPGAWHELMQRLATATQDPQEIHADINVDEEGELLCRTRIWLGTFILEHIFSLDCGKLPGVQASDSQGLRRCRILLRHPKCTALDVRLIAQVELNSIRAAAHQKLSVATLSADAELIDQIHGTKIDLDVWLNDWLLTVQTSQFSDEDKSLLAVNLGIQRDWSELMACCKALQTTGIENIAAMSPLQQEIIALAKSSAEVHFKKLLTNPFFYISSFRYAMDFVWAKCAFSVLFLLKLAIVTPGVSNLAKLIADSRTLLGQLSTVHGPQNIYYRILSLSVEKGEKALRAYEVAQAKSHAYSSADGLFSASPTEAELDFQSYVPKEFVFEWDFPCLTLCYIPMDFQDLFNDFNTAI